MLELTKDTADWSQVAEAIGRDAARHDADDSFVAEAYALLKRSGAFTAHVPAELGGGDMPYAQLCALVRTLARACGSTGLAFSMHSHLVALSVWRWRHQGAPTDGLLRRVAAENLVLVSSGGSDWLKSAGVALKADGGYRVTARKVFSSGSPAGDLLMTSAVHEAAEGGAEVLHFAVPMKAEGVTILDTWRVMGMRGTGSHDVELNSVFVPDAAISGRRPQGKWHPLFHAISMLAFPIIYSAYLGVADGARAKALEIARKKPADDSLVALVGEMENAWIAAETAVDAMIALAETASPGPETTGRTMSLRTLAGQSSIRTVDLAMETAGGASIYRSVGLERAFRDIQGARFHPLQARPQQRYAGRLALGLDIDG